MSFSIGEPFCLIPGIDFLVQSSDMRYYGMLFLLYGPVSVIIGEVSFQVQLNLSAGLGIAVRDFPTSTERGL